MLYKQHYARLKLRLYLTPLSIPADLNTKFYCISYKFRTGSHDGQTISQYQQPNKMMQRCKKTLRSSNQAFQRANSHQLKALGSENFSVQLSYLCNYYFFFFQYHSLYAEKKMALMPVLCLMVRLQHYAQNYAGIMYLTLVQKMQFTVTPLIFMLLAPDIQVTKREKGVYLFIYFFFGY